VSINESRVAGGGSGVIEKNRSRRRIEKSKKRSVEYIVVGYKVAVAIIIIFKMCKKEGI
jgi:uncharacterized membrane protein